MTAALVVGVPRSGSTWLAAALSAASSVSLVSEPDNHWRFPFAFRAKRHLPGRFHPMLAPGDVATEFEELWRQALAEDPGTRVGYTTAERARRRVARTLFRLFDRGSDAERSRAAFTVHMRPGRLPVNLQLAEALAVPERPDSRTPHVVVKSVYATLAVEWLATCFTAHLIVLERNPYNVLSSWHERGWLGEPGDDMLDELDVDSQLELSEATGIAIPASGSVSTMTRGACFYALLATRLREAAGRHPEWQVVSHEELAEDPHTRVADVARKAELPWGPESDRALDAMSRPGVGFEPSRASEQLRDVWRRRLSDQQVREIRSVLEGTTIDSRPS